MNYQYWLQAGCVAGIHLQVFGGQASGDWVHRSSVSQKCWNRFVSVLLEIIHLSEKHWAKYIEQYLGEISGVTHWKTNWEKPKNKQKDKKRACEVKVEYKYLKSGLVNFILPCSVAIFSAKGTASSHLDRTHNLSHLQDNSHHQEAARNRQGLKWRPWCGTFTWSGSLSSCRHWDHRSPASFSHESEEEHPEGTKKWIVETVVRWGVCGGDCSKVYPMQQEGQELNELVGRQRLHIALGKGAQVLVSGLKGYQRIMVWLWTHSRLRSHCEVKVFTWAQRWARAMQASASVVSYLKHMDATLEQV